MIRDLTDIFSVGKETARRLSEHGYSTFDDFVNASVLDLLPENATPHYSILIRTLPVI